MKSIVVGESITFVQHNYNAKASHISGFSPPDIVRRYHEMLLLPIVIQ